MNYVLGLGFLVVAVVVGVWGDRTVQVKGGVAQSLSVAQVTRSVAVLGGVGIWFLASGGNQ